MKIINVAQWVLVSALVGSVYGKYPHHGYGHSGYGPEVHYKHIPAVEKHVDYYARPSYSYSYGVKDHHSGDFKNAAETREGGVVKGEYSLLQPDGVFRTVKYVADPVHGFQAEVLNSGPGVHAAAKIPAITKAIIADYPPHHNDYHHSPRVYASPVLKKTVPAHPHPAPVHHGGYGHGYHAAAPYHAPAHHGYAGHGHGHYSTGHVSHGTAVTHYAPKVVGYKAEPVHDYGHYGHHDDAYGHY